MLETLINLVPNPNKKLDKKNLIMGLGSGGTGYNFDFKWVQFWVFKPMKTRDKHEIGWLGQPYLSPYVTQKIV